jgi:hypothetical protein
MKKTATIIFFKIVNIIRKGDEKYNHTDEIKDQNGNPLLDPSRINNRCREYFKDLLNPMKWKGYQN